MSGLESSDQEKQAYLLFLEAKAAGGREMVKGVLWFAGALIFSIGTYVNADVGESYYVFWGALAYGGYRLVRGLYYFSRPVALLRRAAGTDQTEKSSHRKVVFWALGAVSILVLTWIAVLALVDGPGNGAINAARGDIAGLLDGLHAHTAAWNRGVAPVVEAYLDEDVFADEMVDVINAHWDELEAAVDGLTGDVAAIRDNVLATLLAPVVLNYEAKLAAVGQLRSALIRGDSDRETQAVDRMTRLATEGQLVVLALLDDLAREGFITAAERDQARSRMLSSLATQTSP